MRSVRGHLVHQPAHVGPLDSDTLDRLRCAAWTEQVDLRLSRPGDVDMGRLMILRVDYEAEAMGTVDDDHAI